MKSKFFPSGLVSVSVLFALFLSADTYSSPSEVWYAAFYKNLSIMVEYSFELTFAPRLSQFVQEDQTHCVESCDASSSALYETECQILAKLDLGNITVQSGNQRQVKGMKSEVVFQSRVYEYVPLDFKCPTYSAQEIAALYENKIRKTWDIPKVYWTLHWDNHAMLGQTHLVVEANVELRIQKNSIPKIFEDKDRQIDLYGFFLAAPSATESAQSLKERRKSSENSIEDDY